MERNQKSAAPRAAACLRERYPQLTRRQIEEALESGLCTYRGRAIRKGDRLDDPGALECVELEHHLERLRSGSSQLNIPVLSEDGEVAIVDKPAGVASHPLSLFDAETVTHWAFARYPTMRAAFAEALPTVVPHRLDTGTSGCLIVAKNAESYHKWRNRFQKKEVTKTYQAWCWGKPRQSEMEVEATMAHDPRDRRRMVVLSGRKVPEPYLSSKSSIRVLATREDGLFRAEIHCRTGVTHQVRVHLASLGFPLVGDALYDPDFAVRRWRPSHHLLRASRLAWSGNEVRAPMAAFERLSGERT